MIIKEITDTSDIDLLLSVVESYPDNAKEIEAIKKQLLFELSQAGDNRHIFADFDEDKIVAFIQIILRNADRDPDLANGKDMAHLHNLQVRSDLQGQGIGRQMMAFIEDKAKQMGKRILTLGVDSWNERAIRLYKGLGYEVFKEEPGRFPGEKGISMKKFL
jgi:ribosomal protein S18 acetylase RimI-like enzyme